MERKPPGRGDDNAGLSRGVTGPGLGLRRACGPAPAFDQSYLPLLASFRVSSMQNVSARSCKANTPHGDNGSSKFRQGAAHHAHIGSLAAAKAKPSMSSCPGRSSYHDPVEAIKHKPLRRIRGHEHMSSCPHIISAVRPAWPRGSRVSRAPNGSSIRRPFGSCGRARNPPRCFNAPGKLCWRAAQ